MQLDQKFSLEESEAKIFFRVRWLIICHTSQRLVAELCCNFSTDRPACCVRILLLRFYFSDYSGTVCRPLPRPHQLSYRTFKIQDYYLIREIKTLLNINHITVHNNTYGERERELELELYDFQVLLTTRIVV